MSKLSDRAVIRKVEKSIWQVADQYHGDGAFYFYYEADVQCRLFSTIQENLRDREVVHAEWRSGKPAGWYDLVIWRKDKKREAIDYWGKKTSTIMKKVPALILAAIEIDCLYGGTGKANRFTTGKKLRGNRDIEKLVRGIHKAFDYCYFLMFWDDEASTKYRDTSRKISMQFKRLKDKYGVRSLCVSRAGIVFKHGFVTRGNMRRKEHC